MEKQVVEIDACLGDSVKVTLTNILLEVNSFNDYVDLYLGANRSRKDPLPSKRQWEIFVILSKDKFQQISFVNSIATTKGVFDWLKETLILPESSFGSECKLSKDILKKDDANKAGGKESRFCTLIDYNKGGFRKDSYCAKEEKINKNKQIQPLKTILGLGNEKEYGNLRYGYGIIMIGHSYSKGIHPSYMKFFFYFSHRKKEIHVNYIYVVFSRYGASCI
ncbi:predicted protein [Arabidopsis lyrata subsp. lyrata]|uniref:DNA topoisomerase (ATP-hydrolyzing) n=1 Tax=Arabidopsis lyrata subsp. lyrata TaxID=81972 RepID=D7MRP5_ARALL|nr:predicted protein [Arabidopsis lyrata subsp. lyrata]